MRLVDLEAFAAKLIDGGERREQRRVTADIPVHAVISHPKGIAAMVRDGVIEDLTEHGASLRTELPIQKGWVVKATLAIGAAKIDVQGRVGRRQRRTTEAGIVHVHAIEFESSVLLPVEGKSESWTVDASPATSDNAAPARPVILANNSSSRDETMTTRSALPVQDPRATAGNPLLVVLGGSARIQGRFEIEESIEVQCQIAGELQVGGTLVIGERAQVSAEVGTVNAVIRGQYDGNLRATGSVEIAATARVTGSIETNEILIERGAVFTGSVTRIGSAAAGEADTVTLASQTGAAVVFDADRPLPVSRAPLADVPASRVGRGAIELT